MSSPEDISHSVLDISNAGVANDAAVVHNTGAETIAGVKTFSSSPIVPTPVGTTDAANKTYVDSAVTSGAPDATTSTKGIVKLAGDLAGTAALPTVPGLTAKATDSAVVHNTGDETVAGIKTFSSAPVVPSSSFPESAITNLTTDLAAKATDTLAAHLAGTETFTGAKTFNATSTLGEAANIALGTTTGSIIGTTTSQKLGFYAATPVVQQAATIDPAVALSNLGLRAAGTAYTFLTTGIANLNGGLRMTPAARTGAVTLSSGSVVINLCDATSGAFTVTLPTAVGNTGQIYTIKRTSSAANNVTVGTTSSQTIDGSTTYVLSAQYKYVSVVSDGANWSIIANN